MAKREWWDRWYVIAAIALASAIPLIWPAVPPLVDVPGHIGRFRVELDLASSPQLQQFFDFKWRLIGNLGVDLLIIPLEPLLGLEQSVKVVVLTIPVLTTLGLLWVAKEVDGNVPPTALFAVPFIYGYPFNFGFINYALSMALALLAFALWLRLSRSANLWVRSALFVPLSCMIWIVHAFGWGVLGLLAWSSELVRLRDSGSRWPSAVIRASASCIPLALPLLLMIFWRSGNVEGTTEGYFAVLPKIFALLAALRDRWLLWDSISVGVAVVLIGSAIFDKHLAFARRLAIPAAVLAVIFVLMPGQVFGSAYADMRLAPYMLMLAVLAIRPRQQTSREIRQRIAILACAFAAARIGGNTISFALADAEANHHLEALQYIPQGARVLSLVGDTCGDTWEMPRHSHLGSFVIVRKHGFSNDQWQLAGAQLLRVKYEAAGKYAIDPSEVTFSRECQERIRTKLRKRNITKRSDDPRLIRRTADRALEGFPRNAFDFVWLIEPQGFTMRQRPGLELIWSGPNSFLYRVARESGIAPQTGSRD